MSWTYYAWHLDTSMGVQSISDDLNDKARQGLELIAVVPYTSAESGPELLAIVKRSPESEGGD